jgi:hypothetical protein
MVNLCYSHLRKAQVGEELQMCNETLQLSEAQQMESRFHQIQHREKYKFDARRSLNT